LDRHWSCGDRHRGCGNRHRSYGKLADSSPITHGLNVMWVCSDGTDGSMGPFAEKFDKRRAILRKDLAMLGTKV
jgi:hypothetical protein